MRTSLMMLMTMLGVAYAGYYGWQRFRPMANAATMRAEGPAPVANTSPLQQCLDACDQQAAFNETGDEGRRACRSHCTGLSDTVAKSGRQAPRHETPRTITRAPASHARQ